MTYIITTILVIIISLLGWNYEAKNDNLKDRIHIVQKCKNCDSTSGIAKLYGLKIEDLCKMNPEVFSSCDDKHLKDKDGELLIVGKENPDFKYHNINQGEVDDLEKLAKNFNTSVENIKNWNKDKNFEKRKIKLWQGESVIVGIK